jgi:hypothetical protein
MARDRLSGKDGKVSLHHMEIGPADPTGQNPD